MAPDELRQLLRANPFRPFRVYLAGGQSYVVAGPEWMMVTTLTSALGIPRESGDGDRILLLDNMSITHTEPADSVPTAANPA
jgi:hypothetical protein